MPRSLKKGPFVDDHLLEEGRRPEREEHQAGHQDLVASVDDHPRLHRTHLRRPRRTQACAGVRLGGHGRPQAGRVRADPDLQGSHQGRPEEQAAMSTTTVTEYPSATAKARFVHISASKARRVIDLVRGKSVTEALDILRWAPQAASEHGRQGHRQCCRQRAEQRWPGPVDPRGRDRLRRRGPDRQAHPSACAGAGVPDPQAHQPHHRDRREPPEQGQGFVHVGQRGPRAPRSGQQGRREQGPRQEGACQEGGRGEGRPDRDRDL